MRLSFIQHEQAVHVKRRRHFLGVLFVLVGLLKLCRYLGTSNKVAMFFFIAVSIKGSQLLLYALIKKIIRFYSKKICCFKSRL